ncbi:Fur family transcriptional regulator [Humibacter ginsenosidimutans]|uniref:Fur family transcriptional regulator n=1 Tax=Humibacter ginsenosidimutans TaxID=2599293 RepID=UPI00143DD091|nr:transcriptional repressor [Humibacter ginsenosidimutans]
MVGSEAPGPSGALGPARVGRVHRYRSVVLDALGRCTGPTSAQDLYTLIRSDGARVGLATVYRELHALALERRIYEIRIGTEAAYQLTATDVLVCDHCGRTEEIARRSRVAPELAEFFTGGSPIAVHGRCRNCTQC